MAVNPTVNTQGPKKFNLRDSLMALVDRFNSPLALGLLAFGVYFLLSFVHGVPWGVSRSPFFSYLADAFLHGQIYLRLVPPNIHDLTIYQGRYYLYWPPFPAIFLIPFVLLFGVKVSDILITLVIASTNVVLVGSLLKAGNEAGLFQLSVRRQVLLVLFFAFGTVQLTLAPNGRVWFLAQELGFLLVALAYLAALKLKGWKAFLLTGLCIAGALATRNGMVFAVIWPVWYLMKGYWSRDYKKLAGYLFLSLFPAVIAGCLLIYYNIARFGSPLEFGITYQDMAQIFRTDFAKYGAFNLHYLPMNLYYQYINYPFFNLKNFFQGGSLFLLSPIFFAVFTAIWKYRRNASLWVLLLTIFLVNIPIILLMGTGWVQFGPRYTFDFTVPLLLLTAMGIQSWRKSILEICLILSCFQYFVGYLLLMLVI